MTWDPSIILGAKQYTGPDPNETMRTLGQLALMQTQRQEHEASLADLLNQRTQAQAVQNAYRANPDDPAARVRGLYAIGAGDQARQEQDQASQQQKMLTDLFQHTRQRVTSLLYGTKDQADYEGRLSRLDPRERAMFSPPATWHEAKPLVEALAIPPEKRAELERQGREDTERERHNRAAENRPVTVNTGTGQRMQYNPDTGEYDIPVGGTKPAGAEKPLSQKDLDKDFNDLKGHVLPESTRKLLGQLEQNITRAEEFQNFVHDKTGKTIDLTPQQTREATTMFAQSVQNGGQPAIGQIEHLVPDTLASRFANWKQLLTDSPQGAKAQEFIEQLVGSTIKAKQVAEAEQKKIALKWFSGTGHLKKADPKRYGSIAKAAGLDAATLDDNGDLIQPPAGGGGSGGATGPHGPTVTQGGHTFNWNQATGKYE